MEPSLPSTSSSPTNRPTSLSTIWTSSSWRGLWPSTVCSTSSGGSGCSAMDLTREWEKWPPRTQRRQEVPGSGTTNMTTHQDKNSKILGTTSIATIGTTTELTTTITAESNGEDDPQPLYFYFYQPISKFKNRPARTNPPPIGF